MSVPPPPSDKKKKKKKTTVESRYTFKLNFMTCYFHFLHMKYLMHILAENISIHGDLSTQLSQHLAPGSYPTFCIFLDEYSLHFQRRPTK